MVRNKLDAAHLYQHTALEVSASQSRDKHCDCSSAQHEVLRNHMGKKYNKRTRRV